MYKGILLSLFASGLFSVVYYYPVFLSPLSTVDVFCWRLMTSFPAILIFVLISGQWSKITPVFYRIKKQPSFLFSLMFSAFMISIQMFIFVWGPLNGKALSTSLGYFMLPITMVVTGYFVYKEPLSFFKKIAVSLAFLGVICEIYITQSFSWETAVISLAYPFYFIFRRKIGMGGIAGTFFDFFFISIGCLIYYLITYDSQKIINEIVQFNFYLPILGIITAIAFSAYFAASHSLPLGLFGLLGYFEPIFLTFVSIVFLHEMIEPQHILFYGLIWIAVCVLILEGILYSAHKIRINKHKND